MTTYDETKDGVDKRYTSYLIDHPTGCTVPKFDPRTTRECLELRSSKSLVKRRHGKHKVRAKAAAFKDKDGAFRLVSRFKE